VLLIVLIFCVVFFALFVFVLFHLVIVLSVRLRITDLDYPFGILKRFRIKRWWTELH